MHLPRRLSASTLGDLLGTLYRGKTTGVLELRESSYVLGLGASGRVHRIHLFCGSISGIETPFSFHPLGQMLKKQGLLHPSALEHLLLKLERGDTRMSGVILIEEGLVPKESVQRGLRMQLREKIESVYTLGDAEVRFYTARPLSESARRLSELDAKDFLHGRPRARDRIRNPFHAARQSPNYKNEPEHARPFSAWPFDTEIPGAAHEETPPPTSGVRLVDEARLHALKTLGLAGEADIPTIRRAFRRMATTLHPDRFIDAGEQIRAHTTARFAEVSAAYHLLVA